MLINRVVTDGGTWIGSSKFLARDDFLSLLLFQILDKSTRSDDIGVLFGVALEQGIEIALLGINPAINFRKGDRRVADI